MTGPQEIIKSWAWVGVTQGYGSGVSTGLLLCKHLSLSMHNTTVSKTSGCKSPLQALFVYMHT